MPCLPQTVSTQESALNAYNSYISNWTFPVTCNPIYNGSNAFYFNLSSSGYVELTVNIQGYSHTTPNVPYIINMYIDNTITTAGGCTGTFTPPATSINNSLSNTSVNNLLSTISWSGNLVSGYHVITFSQYIPSTLYGSIDSIGFDATSSITFSCILRN